MRNLKLKYRLFRDNEDGSQSVEAVLIFPILFWAYAGMFVFWDIYKANNVTTRAAYTISDLLSRELDSISTSDVNGMNDIFNHIVNASNVDLSVPTDIIVSIVKKKLNDDGVTTYFALEGSRATSGQTAHSDIAAIESRIPEMAVGDKTIVVETFALYDPIFNLALDSRYLTSIVATPPRFAANLSFTN